MRGGERFLLSDPHHSQMTEAFFIHIYKLKRFFFLFFFLFLLFNMTGEKTPLLTKQNDTCCSEQGCCSNSGSSQQDPSEPIVLQKENECGLSDQPWKYKVVALLCAMFLAGLA